MSGPWGRATALRGGRFREQSDLSFEITHVLEALVDRRESQVGHRIERPQPLQHRQAHLVGANLEPDPAQLLFDLGGQRLDRVGLEVGSDQVGLAVLERLRTLDPVSYLRFASVYKGFEDVSDFEREVGLLTKTTAPKRRRSSLRT